MTKRISLRYNGFPGDATMSGVKRNLTGTETPGGPGGRPEDAGARARRLLRDWPPDVPGRTMDREKALEALRIAEELPPSDRETAHALLDLGASTAFLRGLDDPALRERWAEAAFRLIRESEYSLLDLFRDRVRAHPGRTLFQDMSGPAPASWTYEQVLRRAREMAGAFLALAEEDGRAPRVAVYAENSVDGACADLACLLHDILDTPLNPHFDVAELVQIIDALDISIVVVDVKARRDRLAEARRRTARPFRIVALDPALRDGGDVFLGEYCRGLDVTALDRRLAARPRLALNQVATVMFTSGSTGHPKGVSMSIYNLVAKRFARAAALPDVGDDEVFLSFLPLYHTFGRFFEMLGAIYWRGTYVAAGNPSADTLFALFPRVNPTAFVSVPVRWAQLHERCLEALDAAGPGADPAATIRKVVGSRLRWGISAAGYLSPKVFRFFQRAGVEAASGFGMTEAAGGITMTPPGGYVDDTHGLPLPGIRARLGEGGELQVGGHYVGRYLEEAGPGAVIPYPSGTDADHWLRTGDVFERLPNGYYRIVDRIKDIYKNNRGQTVAPRKVEDRFAGVPGIKRTFLVGDGRPHNILFIVPDRDDEVLAAALRQDNEREYYRWIVSAANLELAPYERVVNFEVLDRDFDAERGEVTPKGSFNRRAIEAHFADRIEALYRKAYVDFPGPGGVVRVPLWFFRDAGILEDEVSRDDQGLFDRHRRLRLDVRPAANDGRTWLVGDLEYAVSGPVLDLGIFARQPLLWAANPALIAFAPCKDGWDTAIEPVGERVALPRTRPRVYTAVRIPEPAKVRDAELARLSGLLARVLFAGAKERLDSTLGELEDAFTEPSLRTSGLIRSRLRAMARHPREAVRCWAYRLLLFDRPSLDYGQAIPEFVKSGLIFLDSATIEAIVSSPLGTRRFDAFRKRMAAYRETLAWPADPVSRRQFERLLRLFVDIGRRQPVFLRGVRAELASWMLHDADPKLAAAASRYMIRLDAGRPDEPLATGGEHAGESAAADPRIVVDDAVPPAEAARVRALLGGTGFLKESVRMAYGEELDAAALAPASIWVSPLLSSAASSSYRVSVSAAKDVLYDFRVVVGRGPLKGRALETLLWSAALADPPAGRPALPALGAARLDSGAVSWKYVGHLTLWEKIRGFAARRDGETPGPSPALLRRLFVESMSAFVRAWRLSGRRIVPGRVSPDGVVVPEREFVDEAVITGLDGRRDYRNTLSLVRPLVDNFYRRTAAHYPWFRAMLDVEWIFDACYDALGREEASAFFAALARDLAAEPIAGAEGAALATALAAYREEFERTYAIPFPARNAVRAYQEWDQAHPLASPAERERKALDLIRRYDLERFPEIVRYFFYRQTYFAGRSERVEALFDRLLAKMGEDVARPVLQRLELSDLQASLRDDEDRKVFGRMVFPRLGPDSRLDIVQEGEDGAKRVVIQSRLRDRRGAEYTFHPTVDPAEIGELYRMFYKESYPKVISPQDRHFVATDSQGRVVGGLCFRLMSSNVRFIDAVVVTSRLKSVGLGRAMVDEFCGRMASQGVTIVLTHNYLPGFFLRRGFRLDRRWGALVKYL